MKSTPAVQICTTHSALVPGLPSPLLPISSFLSLYFLAFMYMSIDSAVEGGEKDETPRAPLYTSANLRTPF